MTELANIVTMRARAGGGGALDNALRALVGPTRLEPGCTQCLLHRSMEEDGLFMVYERWRDAAAFATHMATPHVADFLGHAGELLAEPASVQPFEPLS